MPLFKKSSTDAASLTESHVKALHRCRIILIKDIDIVELLDILVQEDALKPDMREYVLGFGTREQRVGAFIDKLETRGERVFSVFMEVLRERHKHLHYMLEETIRNIEGSDSAETDETATVSGDTVRRLLKLNMRRKLAHSQGSESTDDLDVIFGDDRDDGDYLDCYALPMCARTQQRHKWIKSSATPRTDFDQPATTFVATVASDLVLHRLERFDLIPPGVRRPPKHCLIFVQEQEEVRTEGSGDDDDSETSKVDLGGDDRDKQEMPEEAAPPPPVPPKPENLPPLCVRQSPMRSHSYKSGMTDEGVPTPPPKGVGSTPELKRPVLRPKPRSAHGLPPPPPTETDLDQLDEDPTTPTNKQPPSPSKLGSLSVVAETSREEDGTPRPEQDSGYIGNKSTVTNGVADSDTDDDEEEESPYEAVSPGGQVSDDAATRLFVDESAFENGAEKSGSGSRESTPSTDSRGKSPMKDSIRSSTTSGGSDVFPSVQLPTRISGHGPTSPRPPRLQPRSLAEVQVPIGDDQATDSDNSYYEDIENVDHRAPASPSCKSSVSYLDPHSVHAESFERAEAIATVRSVSLSEWQAAGKLMLRRGDLLIAQVTPACEDKAAVSDEASAINKVFDNTTLVFDRGGHALYVPTVLLKRYGEPAGEPWYYPISLTSREASLFLSREKQEGCFIVYQPTLPSSREVAYHLSVCRSADGDILHYNIIENIHGDLMIEGHDNSFMNIQDLVTYFQRNKSQLATRLRRPLKEAKLSVTPGYHYKMAWEIDRTLLSLNGKIIGKGDYGVVCAGRYHNVPVAVKVLQKTDASILEEDDFMEEARMMMGLKHDHVVSFIGVSCNAKPYFIVTGYAAMGNLRDCLVNNHLSSDNIDILFDICVQVTSAMQYLESQRYMLHRDLAARSFLVTEDMCVKLSYFVRARYVTDDYYQAPREERISVKWASPEVLVESCYSSKSDVWALGVVLWQIFSGGERPFSTLTAEQAAVYVTEGGRLDKPTGCSPDLFAVIRSCWRDSPDDRPSFAAFYEKLKSKSSIYYSRTLVPRKPQAFVVPTAESVPPLPTKVSSSKNSSTPNSKSRRQVAWETRDESAKDALVYAKAADRVRQSRERLPTSSSDTSLSSIVAAVESSAKDKDDLKRANKIRKSFRNMITIKSRRKVLQVKTDALKADKAPGTYHTYPAVR